MYRYFIFYTWYMIYYVVCAHSKYEVIQIMRHFIQYIISTLISAGEEGVDPHFRAHCTQLDRGTLPGATR